MLVDAVIMSFSRNQTTDLPDTEKFGVLVNKDYHDKKLRVLYLGRQRYVNSFYADKTAE
jgi:hypothetical protein